MGHGPSDHSKAHRRESPPGATGSEGPEFGWLVAAGFKAKAVALTAGAVVWLSCWPSTTCWAESSTSVPDNPAEVDLTTLSLEELGNLKIATVYGASKHEQKTTEAPSSVSIVTSEDIKQYGYRTLADVLRAARGFYVSFNRAYEFIGVRGFNRPGDFGGRILIMIDGHRLNDPLYDSNFAGTEFPLDVDLIDKIEIIRGPGSALYGNNAVFGIVNVITRRGRDLAGGEISGSYASFDTFTGRLSYGRRFTNGVEFALSGSLLESQGNDQLHFPEFQSVNGGIADHLDATHGKSFFASLSYLEFSLEGGYMDRDKYVPTAPYGTLFNFPGTRESDQKAFADLKFHHEFENDLSVVARLYFDHYRFDSYLPYAYNYEDSPPPGQQTINRDLDVARSYGTELQLSRTFLQRHRATLGTEFRWDSPLMLRNQDDKPPATWLDINKDQEVLGLYFQDEWKIRTNLTLNAGVRYDWYSAFGDTINPRVALIYAPWRPSTFKFLYGTAYRAPNVDEWGYVGPGWISNPDLGPEKIRSYELICEQDLSRHLHLIASLFYNQVQGLIDQTSSGDVSFASNLEDAESRGFELGLEGHWAHGLRGSFSYTFADAHYEGIARPFSDSPRHLVKLNVVVPIWMEKLFAGFEVQAKSTRLTEAGNELPAFAIANLTLFSRDLIKNLELSGGIYNLFDQSYSDPAQQGFAEDKLEQNGRTFRVKLTYRF